MNHTVQWFVAPYYHEMYCAL